jgi:oligopeptide/dipeptide ABC transporter ATP-binding protein
VLARLLERSALVSDVALNIRDLEVQFPVARGFGRRPATIRPVAGVSLTLAKGETVGLVGESGCGKSSLAHAVVRLLPVVRGRVEVGEHDLTALRGRALRAIRRRVQLIFQDPFDSLNPRLSVGTTLAEAVAVGRNLSARECEQRVAELLSEVGLGRETWHFFPHELSGGQRQRVAIARALAPGPTVLIADEPTSALDVPVQARILNLLSDTQRRHQLALLLISHDLPLVRRICQRIAVMYLGHLVEVWPVSQGVPPLHPYTRALAAAAPSLPDGLRGRSPAVPAGEPPSLLNPPSGCPYHPRCPLRVQSCTAGLPSLEAEAPDRWVRCPIALGAKS